MKKNYVYTVKAVGFTKTENGGFITVEDQNQKTYTVKALPFQVNEGGPRTSEVKVYVKDIDAFGRYNLCQDYKWLLETTFIEDEELYKNHDFLIQSIEYNTEKDKYYLHLRDMKYGLSHRFYINNPGNFTEGQIIKLYVEGIKENPINNTCSLALTAYKRPRIQKFALPNNTTDDTFEAENENIEYKSSIVFRAGIAEPAIDEQIKEIVKTIAGFINGNGGTLYIGVTDTLKRCGIEGDFAYLNSSSVDRYNGQYKLNVDGYENKIRNAVCALLNSSAGNLLHFSTNTRNSKTIMTININKGDYPILFNSTLLYQRQGNSTRLLRNDDFIRFVMTRTSAVDFMENIYKNYNTFNDVSSEDRSVTATETEAEDKCPDLRNHDIWHTLQLYTGGRWALDNVKKDEWGEPSYSIDIEKYHKQECYRLLFIYDKCVDVVGINKKEMKSDNAWINNKQKWSMAERKSGWAYNPLQGIICAHKRDMLAVFYKRKGESYIKVINIEDFKTHYILGNQGNYVMPKDGAEECQIFHIPNQYYDRIYKLNKPINAEGFMLKSDKYQYVINDLKSIIAELHDIIVE